MIGSGGLLLLVSQLVAVSVLVLQVGLEKSKELNLDVRNLFGRGGGGFTYRALLGLL
jgi:hypothetical protein